MGPRSIIPCLLACLALHAAGSELTLSSGPAGGVYDSLGSALEALVQRYGRRSMVRSQPSSGSVDNVQRVGAGEAELGLVQCDLLHDAFQGYGVFARAYPELRVIALLGAEALHIVARRELGLTSIDQLKGLRVALGPPGSGSAATGWRALEAHGIGADDIRVAKLSRAEAVRAFVAGELDVVVMVGAVPFTPVREALAVGNLVPLDPQRVAEAVDAGVQLRPHTIDLAVYGDSGAVATLAVDTALICGPTVSDDAAFELAALIFAEDEPLAGVHPSLAGNTPARTFDDAPIQIADGAMRFLDEAGAVPHPTEVYTGMYLYSVTELDLASGSFLVSGYIWFRWKGPFLGDETFDFSFVNATIESIDDMKVRQYRGWRRQSRYFTARFRTGFLMYDYPFDTQVLPMIVEHRWMGSKSLVFVPDTEAELHGSPLASFVGERVQIGDWNIVDVTHRETTKKFETDFGALRKDLWDLRSSRYEFLVTIERETVPYLVKVVFPLMVIVLMAFCVFFIHPKELLAQAGMSIVALLTCVAFHTFQSDSLPDVGYLVTADKFFLLSYVVILSSLVGVVWIHRVYSRGDVAGARKLAARFRRIFLPLFLVPLAYLLLFG